MKKFLSMLFIISFIVSVVPLLALFKPSPTTSYDTSSTTTEITSDTIYYSSTLDTSTTSTSFSLELDNSADLKDTTYTVYNHKTDEIMVMTPQEYIFGVVAGEMPASFHEEALKAQAVAVHSYTLRKIEQQIANPDPSYYGAMLTTDHTKLQAFMTLDELRELWGSSYDLYYSKLKSAIDQVASMVIVYDDVPIIAGYHSISSGKTEDASVIWGNDVPYLRSVESVGDLLSPKLENSVSLTVDEVYFMLTNYNSSIALSNDFTTWFDVVSRTDAGTVTVVNIGGVEFDGVTVRSLFSLKSADFDVVYSKDTKTFTFNTNGYGHFVGMSQYGADYMARQGADYIDILVHYYSDTDVVELSSLSL